MKQVMNEMQLIQLAMQRFYDIMDEVAFINQKEIIETDHYIYADFCARIRVEEGKEDILFYVDVKKNGEKRVASEFIKKTKVYNKDINWIFVAPYISPETGRMLRLERVSYMDLSGNCFIFANNIYISSMGKPNKFLEKREKKDYLSRSSIGASAVIRTMLKYPGKWWQVKELATESGKSIGMASNVKAFLQDREWIREKDRLFRIDSISEMLHVWAKDYNVKRSLSYQYYSLDKVPDIEKQISIWNMEHDGIALLNSFSAAARYAPTVRYNKVYVYVMQKDLEDFIYHLGIKKVETGGNIVISVPENETIFIDCRQINNDYVTSPVQTILDLLGESGRGEEAAEAIINKEYRG